jgi:epoxyqueuosine reductase
MGIDALKAEIASRAHALGFHAFGVARVQPLDQERERLREWLFSGYAGTMSYLERLEKERLDPEALLPGARSVLCFAHSYAITTAETDGGQSSDVHIARYARGRDYHRVLGGKLREIARWLESAETEAQTRVCVDTAPILEKAWGERAGLGWRGKQMPFRAPMSWMPDAVSRISRSSTAARSMRAREP